LARGTGETVDLVQGFVLTLSFEPTDPIMPPPPPPLLSCIKRLKGFVVDLSDAAAGEVTIGAGGGTAGVTGNSTATGADEGAFGGGACLVFIARNLA